MRKVVVFIFVVFLLSGCSPKVQITLLPEEGGRVGKIAMTDADGKQHTISQAFQSLEVSQSGFIKDKQLSENDVIKKFGDVIKNIPKAPPVYMVFFGSGESALDDNDKKALDEIITKIKAENFVFIECSGHADNTGDKHQNKIISMNRVNAVADYLASHGINKKLIETSYYGDAKPFAQGSTSNAKDRRVEIVVK